MQCSIQVNGAERTVAAGTTIGAVVDSVTSDRARVAVERNAAIVPRATYDATEVVDGDVIEVVTLVGGG